MEVLDSTMLSYITIIYLSGNKAVSVSAEISIAICGRNCRKHEHSLIIEVCDFDVFLSLNVTGKRWRLGGAHQAENTTADSDRLRL